MNRNDNFPAELVKKENLNEIIAEKKCYKLESLELDKFIDNYDLPKLNEKNVSITRLKS